MSSPVSAGRPVRVHIESLVLDGVPLGAAPGRRLQAALSRELARLIAAREPGLPRAHQREPALVWDAARPGVLGRALARRVFAALPPFGGTP